nr:hypothetical protein CFP56_30673 [Quercus suber]
MSGLGGRSRACGPSLPNLPTEILVKIVQALIPPDEDESTIDIMWRGVFHTRTFPGRLAIAHVNPEICNPVVRWAYSTTKFIFTSNAYEMYPGYNVPHFAAEPLSAWLMGIGPVNRRSIRRLELSFTVPELLFLFATPETRALLDLPRDLHVWARCLTLMEDLKLNSLHINIFSRCEDTPGGLYPPIKHFEGDYRWAVKAVADAFAYVPKGSLQFNAERWGPIDPTEVELITSSSWNMLHSNTFAYRRDDKLAYPDDEPPGWADPDNVITPYRIPIRLLNGTSIKPNVEPISFFEGLSQLLG